MYDGNIKNNINKVGTYCGKIIPPSYISSDNVLLLHFESDCCDCDCGVTSAGFKLKYYPIN